jgi:hypothetical protein
MDKRSVKIKNKKQQMNSLNRISMYLNEDEALALKENVLYIERLRNISDIMKLQVLKEYNHEELAIALKLSTLNLIDFLSKNLSSSLKIKLFKKINEPHGIAEIINNVNKFKIYLKDKEAKGEISLS